jgi:pimeloyl-ACP methyl ester carboxylesterase
MIRFSPVTIAASALRGIDRVSRQGPFIGWDSQSLDIWTGKYSLGDVATLEGKQTHYLVSGSGRNVLLIHGFFFDSSCWLQNIEFLSRNFRLYAIDLWGFGFSARQQLDYSYSLFSHQILMFMNQLGIDTAVLVGQSLGGGVAAAFATEHPDRVDQLVLVDGSGLPNPDPLMARLFMLPGVGERLLRLRVDAIRRRMLDEFFLFDPAAITPDHFQLLVRSHKISGSVASALSIMRGRFADKLEPTIRQLARRAIPKLVIWGEHDRAIPQETGLKLHAALRGSEYAVVESAGHVPNLEQPEAFNRILAAFLSQAR